MVGGSGKGRDGRRSWEKEGSRSCEREVGRRIWEKEECLRIWEREGW